MPEGAATPAAGGALLRPFLAVTLVVPGLGSTLGVDGGAIFQIFASQDLGLSAAAIGTAFGLGVVSLPVQLWAARMPLWRARRNLQVFLVLAALQAWVLAGLVLLGRGSGIAVLALGITVAAEVSLSVLFATSWQPLVALTLTSSDRQRLNSRIRAIGSGLAAAAVLVFATFGSTGRAVFLAAVGVVALYAAYSVRDVRAPARPPLAGGPPGAAPHRGPLSRDLRVVFLVLSLVNFGALPLVLLYVGRVLSPSTNLGLIGALQLVGALTVAMTWRPVGAGLLRRGRLAGSALVASTFVFTALRAPLAGGLAELVMLSSVALSSASVAAVRMSMLELAHRSVDETSSVRAFTLLDVFASTAVQLGLLAGGLLVGASVESREQLVDPYRIFVLVVALLTLAALMLLHEEGGPATDPP